MDANSRIVQVVMPKDLAAASLRAARSAGISRSALVRQAIRDYLDKTGATNA